jgi:hypothetical protein
MARNQQSRVNAEANNEHLKRMIRRRGLEVIGQRHTKAEDRHDTMKSGDKSERRDKRASGIANHRHATLLSAIRK